MSKFLVGGDRIFAFAEAARARSFRLCYDASGGEDWITVHPMDREKGNPVKLEGGRIAGGLSGKFNGKTLDEAFGARPGVNSHPPAAKATATKTATASKPKPQKKATASKPPKATAATMAKKKAEDKKNAVAAKPGVAPKPPAQNAKKSAASPVKKSAAAKAEAESKPKAAVAQTPPEKKAVEQKPAENIEQIRVQKRKAWDEALGLAQKGNIGAKQFLDARADFIDSMKPTREEVVAGVLDHKNHSDDPWDSLFLSLNGQEENKKFSEKDLTPADFESYRSGNWERQLPATSVDKFVKDGNLLLDTVKPKLLWESLSDKEGEILSRLLRGETCGIKEEREATRSSIAPWGMPDDAYSDEGKWGERTVATVRRDVKNENAEDKRMLPLLQFWAGNFGVKPEELAGKGYTKKDIEGLDRYIGRRIDEEGKKLSSVLDEAKKRNRKYKAERREEENAPARLTDEDRKAVSAEKIPKGYTKAVLGRVTAMQGTGFAAHLLVEKGNKLYPGREFRVKLPMKAILWSSDPDRKDIALGVANWFLSNKTSECEKLRKILGVTLDEVRKNRN